MSHKYRALGTLLTGLALLNAPAASAQKAPKASKAAAVAKATPDYFPAADMMTIGVYYYPEAWPESQWARDFANMRKLGLEFVHMGEFAWGLYEPQEGKYSLDWLERAVKLASQAGLKVVLCTPSAAPPVWLAENHPETMMVSAQGRRQAHGTREQGNWSSPLFRQYVAKINTQLAQRFGQNPAVVGWQIDNELSHYGRQFSYDDFSKTKFQAWLKQKYGTIDNLNRDWGNVFWSQLYQNFEQIRIPNPDELVATPNPHALLDFERWFADEAADYIREQAATLRQHSRHQWVTTNHMATHRDVNPALTRKDVDITTWTVYPVHGEVFPENGPLGFRLGNGAMLGFMHDFTRPLNGYSGVMELQPGQVNWGDVNPQPLPGAVHMWLMHAFGSGANLICSYRYRQPRAGSELYHYGFVGPDGVTPLPGGLEYAQAMREVTQLRQLRKPNATMPARHAARRTALLYNVDNRFDLDNQTSTTRWNSMGHLLRYYRGLKTLNCPVDVITEDQDFSKYPFVVAPAYQLLDKTLVDRWTAYVQNGGHLVLSVRTGQKDRRGMLWEGLWAMPILDLIGAKFNDRPFDMLPGQVKGQVTAAAKKYDWGSWGEQLVPNAGTNVLATYADQFYAGAAAVVTRKLGKGTVTYVGAESLAGDLERDVLRQVYAAANVAVENLPDQLMVNWRDGFWVATNFTSSKQAVPAPASAKLLVGTRELEPGGVAVWQE
ncbi:beta-galactosidase [Hymenobacter properus]|uniref:Beta-galactosidase n=1 Tax=Hymenobacter properus TaxID=2791026 RepID=A0A931BC99_9BACT|nr:beta-galactosidase [Hymenobacter properus]MBF9141144.1 beta-galactosidase [Hymenobacter properus]MBR7719953.1 beta-galactosidase [Microvirga sp. SRT04]